MRIVRRSEVRHALIPLLVACGSSTTSSVPTTTAATSTTTSSTIVEVAGPPLGDPGPPPAASTPEGQVLALVNEFRRRAGVPPVVYDNTLSQGCREHANYMVLNRGTHAMYHLNAHHQDPKLPGATAAGAECGARADLSHSVENIRDAVRGWMGSLYHRRMDQALSLARTTASLSQPSSWVAATAALRYNRRREARCDLRSHAWMRLVWRPQQGNRPVWPSTSESRLWQSL